MTYLKIGTVLLLIVFVVGSGFFLAFLNGVTGLVAGANNGFIAYLPQEAIWVISIIFFGLILSLAYLIFRE